MDEALCRLVTFDFVALHLFSSGGQQTVEVTNILHFIERLDKLHTEVQVVITSPHLSITLLYDLLRRYRLYLNRCMMASSLELLGVPRKTVHFSLEPVLLYMEGGFYVGPLLIGTLVDLVSG